MVTRCVKTFLDKIFIEKKVFSVAQKKELVCVLPFIGKTGLLQSGKVRGKRVIFTLVRESQGIL